ncbi:MAG: hypothetical protein AB1429_03770 [Pseudomonadota bacterium]|jgi:hypothetical protein
MAPPRRALVELHFGQLPVERINRTLDLELEPGEVIFTRSAQAHAERHHPQDFPKCLPYVGLITQSPQFVGDDFRNAGKIELISRIPSLGGGVLVAVTVERDRHGRYHVASVYPVSEAKIQNRRRQGYLKPLQGGERSI